MESRDDEQGHEQQGPDSPSGADSPPPGARATDNGGPAAGPQVIATDDPSINSEFAYLSDPKGDPDQAMVIEASTSRIRESHGSIIPRVYTGVVEHVRPPHERSNSTKGLQEGKRSGEEKGRKGSSGQDEQGKKEERGKKDERKPGQDRKPDRGGGHRGHQPQGPSLMRILLLSGLVSLVFGMIGGWSYSYFFGSSQSDDQQGSGQGSGSSKKSDSSDKGSDKGSDEGSDSGSDSSSGSGKGSRKPGRGSEPETGGGTGARADSGMKRSLGVTAAVIPTMEPTVGRS